ECVMIEIKKVSFQHENAEEPSLKNVSLTIGDGDPQLTVLENDKGEGAEDLLSLLAGVIEQRKKYG
ncbi:MAG: hypothetical protein ACI4MP_03245, partial [Candidatus Ventricola sp.]